MVQCCCPLAIGRSHARNLRVRTYELNHYFLITSDAQMLCTLHLDFLGKGRHGRDKVLPLVTLMNHRWYDSLVIQYEKRGTANRGIITLVHTVV